MLTAPAIATPRTRRDRRTRRRSEDDSLDPEHPSRLVDEREEGDRDEGSQSPRPGRRRTTYTADVDAGPHNPDLDHELEEDPKGTGRPLGGTCHLQLFSGPSTPSVGASRRTRSSTRRVGGRDSFASNSEQAELESRSDQSPSSTPSGVRSARSSRSIQVSIRTSVDNHLSPFFSQGENSQVSGRAELRRVRSGLHPSSFSIPP